MRLVRPTTAVVRIFVYSESRGEGFLRNDGLGLRSGVPRSLLWDFFGERRLHWNGRLWFLVGSELLGKLLQAGVEGFSWQVEMVRRRVGIGG